MGCGASRDAPVSATLSFIPRVEKERDDSSIAPIHLKRLGIAAYDDFFTDFENAVNGLVALHNGLFQATCDVKAALASAASPDPEFALDLELTTDGVLSGPQVLLDVVYAEGGNRPQPLEMRHLLASRHTVAEADRAVGAAFQSLAFILRSLPPVASIRLVFDEAKQLLAASGPGAAAVQPLLPQVNAALETFRQVAPGLRVQVLIVQTPAPGAGTFAWRLVPRSGDSVRAGAKQDDGAENGAACPIPIATPLCVACAYGAAAIIEAAITVAQQAAAVASAMAAATAATAAAANAAAITAASPGAAGAAAANGVAAAAANAVQLQVIGGRRLDAVPNEAQAAAIAATAVASAAAATMPTGIGRSSMAALRTLSLTRPSALATPAPSAAGSTLGINAAASIDDGAAALRRAVTNANHALFRLSKCASAGASAGPEGAALRSREGSGSAVPGALKLVMEGALHAAQHAVSGVGCGEATAAKGAVEGTGGGGSRGGLEASMPADALISADPHVTVASENGSAISGSTLSGAANSSGYAPLLAREVGSEGLTPGWSWMWDWGIEPRVAGVVFPDCLAPRARAVYDAINTAVGAAQAATDQLPLVQREVSTMVEEADAVFEKNDSKLVAAGKDMMTAARLRAALDRNANTISASPALVNLLQAAVAKLIDDLKRGADEMQAVLNGEPTVATPARTGGGSRRRASGTDASGSGRLAGGRSKIARQLQSAAAAAAAAAAGAVGGARRASMNASNRGGGSAGDGGLGDGAEGDRDEEGDGYSAQYSSARDGIGTPLLPGSSLMQRGAAPGGKAAGAAGVGSLGRASLPADGRARSSAGVGVSRRVMLPPLAPSNDSDAAWGRPGSDDDGRDSRPSSDRMRLPQIPLRKAPTP